MMFTAAAQAKAPASMCSILQPGLGEHLGIVGHHHHGEPPPLVQALRSPISSSRERGSREEVGSSRRRSWGSWHRQRARESFCFSPPESRAYMRPLEVGAADRRHGLLDPPPLLRPAQAGCRCRSPRPRRPETGKSTCTDSWFTYPTRRRPRAHSREPTSLAEHDDAPAVARTCPRIAFKSVVFPAPLGPATISRSPQATDRESPRRISDSFPVDAKALDADARLRHGETVDTREVRKVNSRRALRSPSRRRACIVGALDFRTDRFSGSRSTCRPFQISASEGGACRRRTPAPGTHR